MCGGLGVQGNCFPLYFTLSYKFVFLMISCVKNGRNVFLHNFNCNTGTSGVPRTFVQEGGGFNQFRWGQRAARTGVGGRQPPIKVFHLICKSVKPKLLLDCYGCICHGTGNSGELCQNFGISRVEVSNPPNSSHPSVPPVWDPPAISPQLCKQYIHTRSQSLTIPTVLNIGRLRVKNRTRGYL
jgi:hypothetical protein